MASTRRLTTGIAAALAVLTAAVLWEVLGTLFFAVTLVYVAEPLYRALLDRGLGPRTASAIATAVVFAAAVGLLVPFAVVLYQRRADVVAVLSTLPESVALGVGGFEVVLETGEVVTLAVVQLRRLAFDVAGAAPVLGLKLVLLAMVLYALLVRRASVGRTLVAAVPAHHRPVVRRLSERLRETLLAIYVMQAATSLATFAVALPLFVLLGYDLAFVLAVLAGLLQFLPIVGPSVLIAVIAGAAVLAGDLAGAATVGVLGWLLVAMLPDIVVRPKLAEHTAHVPGSLYFVGFTGGVLTVGAVGVIAGPVLVVLLNEAVALLAAETDVVSDVSLADQG